MKILTVGSGGRESALARKIGEDASVYAFLSHENPTIVDIVRRTEGKFSVGKITDGRAIADFAKQSRIDLAFVSSDNPLEAGVIDALRREGILAVGATREGAEIEWNKAFARELLRTTLPDYAPQFWVIKDSEALSDVFDEIEKSNLEIVVKPAGLTAGKGVKVMGEHLADHKAARKYAADCLVNTGDGGKSVVIEEKLVGVEFTVQAITDGKSLVRVPATFDYPYRYDGDSGPGTGGMGSFCEKGFGLPFLNQKIYDEAYFVIETVLHALAERDRHFSGVIYGGFFLTARGLRVTEFNARFGDPECINIMSLMESSFVDLLQQIASAELNPGSVKMRDKASVVKYLVAPEYAIKQGKEHEFYLDVPSIEKDGVAVLFSSALASTEPCRYKTIGNSRNVALATLADTPPEAAGRIDDCIRKYFKGPLEYRLEVGSAGTLKRITPLIHG